MELPIAGLVCPNTPTPTLPRHGGGGSPCADNLPSPLAGEGRVGGISQVLVSLL
jgi:hypothetical protein